MKEQNHGYQVGRRSFLRTAAAVGIGTVGVALAHPLTASPVLAATQEDNETHGFVKCTKANFTLDGKTFFFAGTNNY